MSMPHVLSGCLLVTGAAVAGGVLGAGIATGLPFLFNRVVSASEKLELMWVRGASGGIFVVAGMVAGMLTLGASLLRRRPATSPVDAEKRALGRFLWRVSGKTL